MPEIISVAEYNEIKDLLKDGLRNDSLSRKEQLKQKSLNRIKTWDNTIQSLIIRKKEMKLKEQELFEANEVKKDEQEAIFQQKQKEKLIQRALEHKKGKSEEEKKNN